MRRAVGTKPQCAESNDAATGFPRMEKPGA
jgi:hypothetical protein